MCIFSPQSEVLVSANPNEATALAGQCSNSSSSGGGGTKRTLPLRASTTHSDLSGLTRLDSSITQNPAVIIDLMIQREFHYVRTHF